MDNKLMESWQEYSQSALSAAKELEVINTQVLEKLTSKQMELANSVFETGTRYASSLSEVKGYQEFAAAQTKVAAEFYESMTETARGSADIISEAREAYQSWFENGLKTITKNADFSMPGFAPAAKKTAKKAA